MDLRKLAVLPMMVGALTLGACGAEEEEGVMMEEEAGLEMEEGVGVEEGMGVTEILGNGIDDDGDGLIDEEA